MVRFEAGSAMQSCLTGEREDERSTREKDKNDLDELERWRRVEWV
jgi:hypothetical protein